MRPRAVARRSHHPGGWSREEKQLIGEVLTKLGFVGSEDLLKALGAHLGLGRTNLAQVEIPKEVLGLLKHESVKARRMLPISKDGRKQVLGRVDPTDFQTIEEAQKWADSPHYLAEKVREQGGSKN